MTEEIALQRFMRKVREDGPEARIELLRHYAGLKVDRPADWNPAAVRAEGPENYYAPMGDCFACFSRSRRTYWHHVIQVQHGGSNDTRNLVRICHACHQRIHPWLPVPDTFELRRGPVLLGDWLKRVEVSVRSAQRGETE